MRYGMVLGSVVVACLATGVAAQDRDAFCLEAKAEVGNIAQGLIDIIDSEGAFAQAMRVVVDARDDDDYRTFSALADAKLERLADKMRPAAEGTKALRDLLQDYCAS